MKKIQYILIVLLLVCCKDSEKNNLTKTPAKDSVIVTQNPKKSTEDTVSSEKPNLTDKDTIFLVNGLPFDINGIKCYWEYKVKKVFIKKNDALNIIILYQKLKTIPEQKNLFETANEVENSNYFNLYHSLNGIVKSKAYNLECEDIDFDGYCDFKILIETVRAGANQTYEVYLFNPKNKKFEYSKVFSGTNIEYDKEKNRISYMWKMGARSYSFGYANLKKNKRDIAFFENIDQDQDTIIYTKSIGKKIIETKKVVLKKEDWQGDEVHQEDSQFLLERNKK